MVVEIPTATLVVVGSALGVVVEIPMATLVVVGSALGVVGPSCRKPYGSDPDHHAGIAFTLAWAAAGADLLPVQVFAVSRGGLAILA